MGMIIIKKWNSNTRIEQELFSFPYTGENFGVSVFNKDYLGGFDTDYFILKTKKIYIKSYSNESCHIDICI